MAKAIWLVHFTGAVEQFKEDNTIHFKAFVSEKAAQKFADTVKATWPDSHVFISTSLLYTMEVQPALNDIVNPPKKKEAVRGNVRYFPKHR